MKASPDYLSEVQSWQHSSDVKVESLASVRALYFANALESLRKDYDGSPLEAVVFEINQNNSVSIWVESETSRKSIVSRFREGSNGYENKNDAEILDSITPWYYDAFKYACVEFSCTDDFKKLVDSDNEFCERNFDEEDDDGLFAVSRDAAISAILKLEVSGSLDVFDKAPGFEIRIFSDESDTITPGEHCWGTNKLLINRRAIPQSEQSAPSNGW